MKKATNPLALDLRAGGFEVFPIAKIFDLPSNVWYPSILIRENLLAEPFAAWAANVFYTLGGVQVLQWTDGRLLASATLQESNMQKKELNCTTIGVANNRDVGGTVTADEIYRGFRTAKVSRLWRIACSIFLWSLMVAGLFIVLVPVPGRADNDKDIHLG